ncbi:hypothetical protein GCM10010191_66070 [Actinomadura vinacea]|uniref:Uncharacterized protein n=1 Tax=Actinomadura vinacea TaxID=115336 RepID=A0ABN3JUJ0_9ACTN
MSGDDMAAYTRSLRARGVSVPEIKLAIPTGKSKGRHPTLASVYRVPASVPDHSGGGRAAELDHSHRPGAQALS